jgi:integrase
VPRRRFQRGRLIQRGKNPMWVGMFREDRLQPTFKRIRRTVTLGPVSSMSRRHALAVLQPYLDAVNTSPAPPVMKKGRTFAAAVKEWREQIAVNLKPSTVRAAESHLMHHIEPRLGTLFLQDMTVKTLQAFVTSTAATGVTRKTLENILQTVFSILRTARMFGNSLPSVKRSDLMLPRDETRKEVRFLSAKEVGRIINRAKEPYATMFAVMGMTGCRVGEMLGLKTGDLDFNRKVIYICRSIDSRTRQEQSTKTKHSTVEVPMPAALEKRLRAFLSWTPRKPELLPVRQPKRHPLFGRQGDGIRTLASARSAGHPSHRYSRIPPRGSKRASRRRSTAHCRAAATASRRCKNNVTEVRACCWRFATPCSQHAGRKDRTFSD